jgi:hypothetical protein
MSRLAFLALLLFAGIGAQGQTPRSSSPAESAQGSATDWTVMVYMNAKNNLECAGIANFNQMASVGSSDRVSIVVELGRPAKKHYTNDEEGWGGVLRFHVVKGAHPIPSSAIDPDNTSVRNADMGNGGTLSDFVRWTKQNYPAHRYMLVIWNHGQGWRLYQTEALAKTIEVAYRHGFSFVDDAPQPCKGPDQQTLTGGVRSVSFDEDSGNFLYNRAIQNSLRDQHLDILGFDACLMAMIETAYAFRSIAPLMVASEETIPGDGWNYSLFLGNLIQHPAWDAPHLAKDIVQTYKETYQDAGDTTLSVIDLTKVEEASRSLAKLSLLIKGRLSTEAPVLAFARLSFRPFGDWYQESWQDFLCCGPVSAIGLSRFVRFLGHLQGF